MSVRPPSRNAKHDYDAAWCLYLAGATCEEISEKLNIPYGAINRFAREHFWVQRRATARDRASKAIKDDLTKQVERARERHTQFMLDQLDETQEKIADAVIGTDRAQGQITIGQKLDLIEKQDTVARRALGMDKEHHRNLIEEGFAMLCAMGKGPLVNESYPDPDEPIDVEITSETVSQKEENERAIMELQDAESNTKTTNEGSEETPENTPSAIGPLPEDKKANTGILSSLNAIGDERNTPENDDSGQTQQDNRASQETLPDKFII